MTLQRFAPVLLTLALVAACGGEETTPDAGSTTTPDAGETKGALGAACDTDEACASGQCVDGVCCNTACEGGCEACTAELTGGADGTCAPVTDGLDPRDHCAQVSDTCQTGACNGAGACKIAADGEVCRAALGACDVAELCAQGACPADTVNTDTETVCRPAAGPCDAAESCDGTSPACPADAANPNTSTVCREAAGPCDAEETCDGATTACPADAFKAATAECRGSAGACDVAEQCTGSSADCPADAKAAATQVCRPAAGACDVAETCDGTTDACPGDTRASSTQVCRPVAGPCDVAESCNGSAADCPGDGFLTGAVAACTQYQCRGEGAQCPTTCRTTAECPEGPRTVCSNGACVEGKFVFISDWVASGNLGGLTGADGKCFAQRGTLSDNAFKAWLSSSTVAARDRLAHGTVPYILKNKTIVADNWDDLVDGTLDAAINIASGGASAGNASVYTGTNADGTSAANTCGNWASTSGNGEAGRSADTGAGWSRLAAGPTMPCNPPTTNLRSRLYCFEQ